MLPRRSSSGRRSSILKPPKTRQPFQDLDFNTSSPDISPEGTKKRRVSFAEKKHVKEFCDHKEQGTIWDSTYEEADQNVSKLTETSNENAGVINTGINRYIRNVDTGVSSEAGFNFSQRNGGPTNPESYVIMDSNSVENSSSRTYLNSGQDDLDFTEIIPCSQGISNDLMSQTIFCQDADLEITEAIGGIERTVSLKKMIHSQAREGRALPCVETEMRKPEKTIFFDNSGDEMNFTLVVSDRKNQTPLNFGNLQELETNNSCIENETIIFEDSIMELTLPNSPPNSGLELDKNALRDPRDNMQDTTINSGSNKEKSDCGIPQNINKTVFFQDFGCEITEAIGTVKHKVPGINLEKEKLAIDLQMTKNSSVEICGEPREGINCFTASRRSLSDASEPNPRISDPRGNETIFFNDFGCEITEAINMRKTSVHPVDDENVKDTDDLEEIVINSKRDVQRVLLDVTSNPSEASSPKLILAQNNQTKISNDSVMDFTTAITRENNLGNETQQTERCELRSTPLASTLNRTQESLSKLISEDNNETEYLNDSGMEFTTAITRGENVENEVREENCTLRRNQTVIFDNCDVSITQSVRAAPCALNSGSNSEEREDFLSTECRSSEVENKKKRKSDEITANIDCNKSSNSMLSKNPELDLVQSLVLEESIDATNDKLSNTFAPDCKRLKITDENAQEKSLPSENDILPIELEELNNISRKSVHISSLEPPDLSEIKDTMSENLGTENDSVKGAEDVPIISDSNCSKDVQDKSVIDETREAERAQTDVSEEESSVIEATLGHFNSDSDSETLELTRAYEKRQQSLIEKNDDEQSRSEPKICLDYNDDCCFVMFSEELETQAKSKNCIWKIRSLDSEKVLIDFISKSLVVVINLETPEELTAPKLIKDIKIISLLSDSEEGDISMIHNILLKKLDPENLKRLHRTTQDVLPLLETISEKVKSLLEFLYEFDKLQDLIAINRTGNLISFRLHSYKVQLVIKITIDLEPFENIGPNDVGVECVLGNIREKDIKELITGVKKDHKFLTNYIKDIREYIALVVGK